MIRLALVVVAITCLLIAWKLDRAPPHGVIDVGFFACKRCRSLSGGIFGKGPFKNFNGSRRRHCFHDWERMSLEEFRERASRDYGVDWSQESGWWKSPLDRLASQFRRERETGSVTPGLLDELAAGMNGSQLLESDVEALLGKPDDSWVLDPETALGMQVRNALAWGGSPQLETLDYRCGLSGGGALSFWIIIEAQQPRRSRLAGSWVSHPE
ncbi:MAG: hypothetical protein ACOZIN_18735 [Myxococcota bacterium]